MATTDTAALRQLRPYVGYSADAKGEGSRLSARHHERLGEHDQTIAPQVELHGHINDTAPYLVFESRRHQCALCSSPACERGAGRSSVATSRGVPNSPCRYERRQAVCGSPLAVRRVRVSTPLYRPFVVVCVGSNAHINPSPLPVVRIASTRLLFERGCSNPSIAVDRAVIVEGRIQNSTREACGSDAQFGEERKDGIARSYSASLFRNHRLNTRAYL